MLAYFLICEKRQAPLQHLLRGRTQWRMIRPEGIWPSRYYYYCYYYYYVLDMSQSNSVDGVWTKVLPNPVAHKATLIFYSLAPKLHDHGHKVRASDGVPVYLPACAGAILCCVQAAGFFGVIVGRAAVKTQPGTCWSIIYSCRHWTIKKTTKKHTLFCNTKKKLLRIFDSFL